MSFPSQSSPGMVASLQVPAGATMAVLEAMNYHPTSERLQIQGCLALGNIGRTGEYKMIE